MVIGDFEETQILIQWNHANDENMRIIRILEYVVKNSERFVL